MNCPNGQLFTNHYQQKQNVMFDYKEIERTIKDNHLPFQKIEDADKEILTQRLYDTFVFGNPRAL